MTAIPQPTVQGDQAPLLPTSDGKANAVTSSDAGTGPSEHLRKRLRSGLVFMLLSAVSQAVMATLVHASTIRYGATPTCLLLVRASVSLLLALGILLSTGNLSAFSHVQNEGMPFLVLRGLAGGFTTLLQYMALANIEVGKAITLFYIAPVIVSVSAVPMFGESFTPWHCLTLFANFGGITLVSLHAGTYNATLTHEAHATGIAAAMGSAVFSSVGSLCIKRLPGVHAVFITAAHSLGTLVIAMATLQAGDITLLRTNAAVTFYALCVAVCGFAAQTFLGLGLKRAPAGPAVVIRTINVPIVFAIGYLVMGETIGIPNMIGVVLVVGSAIAMGLLVTRSKHSCSSCRT